MRVKVKAPINIALLKYWGKQDEDNVIPFNDSLSLSLSGLYTETVIEPGKGFSYTLNGEPVLEAEKQKLIRFIKQFTTEPININVTSINTGPTAAGVASSASAYAAFGKALDTYYNNQLSIDALAEKVRKGSGSACRSLLGNFVHWKKRGALVEYANPFNDLYVVIVLVNIDKKAVSSKIAMKHTVATSPLYADWVKHANASVEAFKDAINTADFNALGRLTEASYLAMHGTMLAANPPIMYMEDKSLSVIEVVHQLRAKQHAVYATMDAGPNVKILVQKHALKALTRALKMAGFEKVIVSSVALKGAEVIDED